MTERRKPEVRRREIADAALRIVEQRGLGKLTAAEIAREVGVTDAALFHHFRSMEEILLAALERIQELLLEPGLPEQGNPFDRLGEFFRRRVAAMNRNPGAGRLLLSDVLRQVATPSGVAKVKAFRQRSIGFIRSCLEGAQREGALAEGFEVADATVLVFGSLMALTQARDLIGTNGALDSLAGKVWRDLEQTLRRQPAAGRSLETSGRSPKPRSTEGHASAQALQSSRRRPP